MTAAGIYFELQRLSEALCELRESGLVSMSSDSWNTAWNDADLAFLAAQAGIEQACEATRWMETRQVSEGSDL